MTFAEWQAAAQKCADKLQVVAGDNLWDEDDSYDLLEAADAAYKDGEEPADFVRRMFEEDLARQENDELEYQESLEYED